MAKKDKAKLIFNYSAMNSGKTLDLLRTAYSYYEVGENVLVMKPKRDKKAGDMVKTRIGIERKVDILIGPKDNIIKLLAGKIDSVECILIDEAQFLTKNQVKDLSVFCTQFDIRVICYGLRNDYRGKLFPGSEELLNRASEINEFEARCKCGEFARFNSRKVNGEYVIDGPQVLIDGSDKNIEYEPLCEKCFVEKVMMKDPKYKDYINQSLEEVYANMRNNEIKEKGKVLVKEYKKI